jgi:DDE family transposase
MFTADEFNAKAEQLKTFLQQVAEQAGQGSGFVKRRSKISSQHFAQVMILGCLENPEASLSSFCQVSEVLGVPISEPGWHGRINLEAVRFLADLFQRSWCHFRQANGFPTEVLKGFEAVQIVDSSLIRLPKHLAQVFPGCRAAGGEAAMKVQLSWDYRRGQLNAVTLTDGKTPDQRCELPEQFATPGSLTLTDLGYFDQERFHQIAQQGAFFISRLHPQVGLYRQRDAPLALDVSQMLSQCASLEGEIEVYVGSKRRVAVRVLYRRLPEAVAQERRRKAQANAKRRGNTSSERLLALLDWALFITNVPAERLSLEQVMTIYRVRWQVELIFKLWKSYLKVDVMGNWRIERVLCQFYSRLLGFVIFQWLAAPYRFSDQGELSSFKAFKVWQRFIPDLILVIDDQWCDLAALLRQMERHFQRFALKTKRQKSPSTFALLVLVGA